MESGDHMHIASINLRIIAEVDRENNWVYRKNRMIDFIKEKSFDVIGCQEASPLMLNDLKEGLNDLYEFIFMPRDSRGEGTPVLYKKEMKPVEHGSFWLSNTPEKESIVEGSHFPRVCTYVKFKDFIFFNTHLDYVSDDVCLVQANYLIENIKRIAKDEEHILVTGDFNVHPSSKTIQFMNKHLVHDYKENNPNQLTFHGYTHEVKGEPIDYIFHTKKVVTSKFMIHRHQDSDKFLSDHYQISAHVEFI